MPVIRPRPAPPAARRFLVSLPAVRGGGESEGMMEHTPGPWKPDGKHMLITQLVEGKPTRKAFYGIEGKVGNFRDTIAYFINEADRDLCLALREQRDALLATCEELLAIVESMAGDTQFSGGDRRKIEAARENVALARGE